MKKDRYRMENGFLKEIKNSRPNFGELTSYFLVI